MSIGVFSDIGKSSISNQNNGKIKSEQEEKNSVPKKEVFLNKAKNIAQSSNITDRIIKIVREK